MLELESKKLATHFKDSRTRAGLTQAAMGAWIGVNQVAISECERGRIWVSDTVIVPFQISKTANALLDKFGGADKAALNAQLLVIQQHQEKLEEQVAILRGMTE